MIKTTARKGMLALTVAIGATLMAASAPASAEVYMSAPPPNQAQQKSAPKKQMVRRTGGQTCATGFSAGTGQYKGWCIAELPQKPCAQGFYAKNKSTGWSGSGTQRIAGYTCAYSGKGGGAGNMCGKHYKSKGVTGPDGYRCNLTPRCASNQAVKTTTVSGKNGGLAAAYQCVAAKKKAKTKSYSPYTRR
ncbi:MAG: hypothetical protein ACPG1C_02045 [Alphaproteobacteria bacterium]